MDFKTTGGIRHIKIKLKWAQPEMTEAKREEGDPTRKEKRNRK